MGKRRRRVLLVYPDRYYHSRPRKRGALGRLLPLTPPLNLMIVASLTPPSAFEVRIVDERVEDVPFDDDWDLVGITVLTADAPRAYEIADEFRRRGVKVVLGGVHVSVLPEEGLSHADAVVVGEAEKVWGKVLRDLERGELGGVYKGERPEPSEIPYPAWDLLPTDKARYLKVIQATRGCPHNCAFCMTPRLFGRRWRARPVEKVAREVKMLGKGEFIFLDDNLAVNPRYVEELSEALSGMEVRWFAGVSFDVIRRRPDLVGKMARGGCGGVLIGLESISEEALRSVGKGFNLPKAYGEVARRLDREGIGLIPSFIFGFDTDGPDIFDRTVDFLIGMGVQAATFGILTPFPGTAIYEQFRREGRIFERDWRFFDGAHVVFKPARMSPLELREGFLRAYKRFYSFWRAVRRMVGNIKRPFLSFVNLGFFFALRHRWRVSGFKEHLAKARAVS